MHPKLHLILSQEYKEAATRYTPNDAVASLQLQEINLGSSRIVLVPFARFGDTASFPTVWKDRIMLLDMKNIFLRQMFGQRSGETLSRVEGLPRRYKEIWVDANVGVQFHNPLACAYWDVTT
jgi:hypothetical protein